MFEPRSASDLVTRLRGPLLVEAAELTTTYPDAFEP